MITSYTLMKFFVEYSSVKKRKKKKEKRVWKLWSVFCFVSSTNVINLVQQIGWLY
jgi:hypothetical protein